jgi:hypothetical protein
MRIRDGQKFGSGTRYKHPGSATLPLVNDYFVNYKGNQILLLHDKAVNKIQEKTLTSKILMTMAFQPVVLCRM